MMEGHQDRRRSPSVGQQQIHDISHPLTSPHYSEHTPALGLDPSISSSTFTSGAFNAGIPSTSAAEQFDFSNPYLNASAQASEFRQQAIIEQELEHQYKQRNSISSGQQRPSHLDLQDSNHQFVNNFVTPDSANTFANQFSEHGVNGRQDAYDNAFMLDPSLQIGAQPQNQSINPAELISNMNSPQGHLTTPPNMMQVDSRPPSGQSPSLQQGQFYSPNHSRHASLDPSSAGFPSGQQPTDWTGMLAGASFQQHRRAPSEHSEVSSSVAPSPFLNQQDSFESYDPNRSPMLNAQQDSSLYQEALGIERFSLSDAQHQQRQGVSPRRSPYVSPRMTPHQGLGIAPDTQFMLPSNDMSNPYGANLGSQSFKSPAEQDFANRYLHRESSDMGQAAQMAPPEINVELAPPSRQQNYEVPRNESDVDALSPPERGISSQPKAKTSYL